MLGVKLVLGAMSVAILGAMAPPAYAGKGDLKVSVPKRAPLLQGKTLDLRFADFAQGIWVRDLEKCPAPRIDQSAPGSTIAFYRGLMETSSRICQVYGAEKHNRSAQRAAINCLLNDGGQAIELVTVRPRGSNGLMVQQGERPPVYFRFCEKIIPVLQAASSD